MNDKEKTPLKAQSQPSFLGGVMRSLFCKHDYLWVRNVYGDEIFMTGKFKRSWWKCNKCNKWKSSDELHTDGRI